MQLRRELLDGLRAGRVGAFDGRSTADSLRRALNRFGGEYSEGEVGEALQYLADKKYVERIEMPPAFSGGGGTWRIMARGCDLLDGTIDTDAGVL